MTGGYLEVMRTAGALRVFVPALVGRLSFAMVTLVLLFAVQRSTDSFAVAGAATGAFGLANVIASPYRARFVDRRGQRFALNSLAIAFAAGLSGMAALTAQSEPPAGVLVGLAAVVGLFPPPLGASMRVLWGSITEPGAVQTKAFSVDAVCEELLFTTGPLIAAAVVGAASPPVGLLTTALVALLGTLGMTSSPLSLGHGAVTTAPRNSSQPLRQSGFVAILIALLGVGVVLGTVEVVAPAVADSQGSVGLAGILLAAFAAGSAVGGLLYGQRTWRNSLVKRLLISSTLMTVLCALLAALGSVAVLGFGLVVVGFFLAPSLVTGYLLADDITAVEVRTEASSWINTAVNAGAAVAAVMVGLAMDAVESRLGFIIGGGMALILVMVASVPLLRNSKAAAVADQLQSA
ncbi:MFS transporter [Cryobacterium sp. Hz7]|uniref:MFS transporter n=2 Tax=Microbacteriaceae TaxID=85023 RepID=A0ABY2J4L1_9MICO|nr:MFS transporter [Cryobacterium sp. Hz7]TFC99879.1 MFS transporter [Cryobacterium sandaracinum]